MEGAMPGEAKMSDDNRVDGGSTDHDDPEDGCRDTQVVLIEPSKHVNQPASGPSFHNFPRLPWELRRMVWEFALPRSVFTTATLCSGTCVPYPAISLACREAFLVVKEFGSMVTAWDRLKFSRAMLPTTPITNETDIYIRTWFSAKLDTLTVDLVDIVFLETFAEDARCDLINSLSSPTTCLLVHDWSRTCPRYINPIYQQYLKNREKILLSIGDIRFLLKGKVRGTGTASQALETLGSGTQVIHLNDNAALEKYVDLWEHCCQEGTNWAWKNRHCDVGAWLKMAMDEGKREGARGWMRRYKAWVVEDQAYEKRLVSPEVYYVLRIADYILLAHGSRPNRHCGHEIVDYTGKLKKNHPLVRELDIKLPEVIPVCTVSIHARCRCEECDPRQD